MNDPSFRDSDVSQRMATADDRDTVKAASTAATSAASYTDEDELHYRALWEGTPNRPADRSFDDARAAYRLGHLAAYHPDYVGRDFDAAEAGLRGAWSDDVRARHGEWEVARRYVRDAYGHARSGGAGIRRASTGIGTGGSAVDPVELERARLGRPSRDDEQDAPPSAAIPTSGVIMDEITPDEAHRDRLAR